MDSQGSEAPDNQLTPDDEKFEFGVVTSMLSDQTAHRERLDNKIGALIAATGAALYFFIDKAASPVDTILGALFLIPFCLSLWAFSARTWQAPGPEVFAQNYPYYPTDTLRVAVDDTVSAFEANATQSAWKAWRAKLALQSAFALSVIAVAVKIFESFQSPKAGTDSPVGQVSMAWLSGLPWSLVLNEGIQVILAAAAIWLAVETWRLRIQDKERTTKTDAQFAEQVKQNTTQLELLRKQVRLSILPPIVLGPITFAQYVNYLNETVADKKDRKRFIDSSSLKGEEPSFVCLVKNQTKRMALNLSGLLWDVDSKKFFLAPRNLEQLYNGWDAFLFYKDSVDMEEIKKTLEAQYKKSGVEFSYPHIAPSEKDSFVAVFFLDIDGRLYLMRRRFSTALGGKAASELFFRD